MATVVDTIATLGTAVVTVSHDDVTGVVSSLDWTGVSGALRIRITQAGKADITRTVNPQSPRTIAVNPALGYIYPAQCGIYLDGA